MDLPINIRPPIPSDEGYIYRTWLDSYRVTGPMVKQVRDRVFFAYYHKIINNILTRGSRILVASSPDDEKIIYGDIIWEPIPFPEEEKDGVLHWVYVKSTWRRLKVATRLIEATGLDPARCYFTHWTNCELAINAKREAAKRGLKQDWKTLREVKAAMVADKEAKGEMEGDTRVFLRKYPALTYNPFLVGQWR